MKYWNKVRYIPVSGVSCSNDVIESPQKPLNYNPRKRENYREVHPDENGCIEDEFGRPFRPNIIPA